MAWPLSGEAKRLGNRLLRDAYRQERLPPLILWSLAARGVRDWMRWLEKPIRQALMTTGSHPDEAAAKRESRALVSDVAAVVFQRRYEALRAGPLPNLPEADRDPRAVALTMAALHQLALAPDGKRARWLWDAVGGAPRGLAETLRAERLILGLGVRARWHEVAHHLGEMLIAFTEVGATRLPRAPQLIGSVCFEMGVKFAEALKKSYELPEDSRSPEHAIEILRVGEYIFRVNPTHWSGPDKVPGSAFLKGNACLWYSRPGWQRMHCGIFGQFQGGVSSVFGLGYKLDKTIPKHGGKTCRVTLNPLSATGRAAEATRETS